MSRYFGVVVLNVVLVVSGFAAAATAETITMGGNESGKTKTFSVDGPWTLDWNTRSEFPLLANFELRLHDGNSGKFIGTVAQLEGIGRGFKLFEEAGTFQLAIVASNVRWEVEVSEVSESQASQLKGATGDQRLSPQGLNYVRESSFSEWRAVDSKTLLLFTADGKVQRVTFAPPCSGLESATAISFVAPVIAYGNQYDSILLDDGMRCYFRSVSPVYSE